MTSWAGSKIFRLTGQQAHVFADNISTPAQIGDDARRSRLLVPVLRENTVMFYPILSGR